MRTETLREFVTLAQCLNYRVASEKLFISQPRLSEHILALEREIGFSLFVRERPLSLTAEGRVFLETSMRALEDLDDAIANCRRTWSNRPQTLTIMKPPLIEQLPGGIAVGLRRAMDEAEKRHPGVRFQMPHTVTGLSEYDALETGKTDLSYVFFACGTANQGADQGAVAAIDDPLGHKGVSLRTIGPIGLSVWVPSTHPLYQRDAIRPKDLEGRIVLVPACLELSSLRETVVSLFEGSGARPVFRSQFTDTASAFVVAPLKGDEVRILPAGAKAPFIADAREIPLTGFAGRAALGVAYRNPCESEELASFVESLCGFGVELRGETACQNGEW